MVSLTQIPVALDPAAVAEEAGGGRAGAEAFVAEWGKRFHPCGVFDEVDPAEVLPASLFAGSPPDWGGPAVVGLCSLGLEEDLSGPEQIRRAASRLLLRDALSFLEYRVRQYLKPVGREPGGILLPGCPEMPLAANRAILDHFGPDMTLGLHLDGSGGLDASRGTAFVYPTGTWRPRLNSLCAQCSRKDCPSRLQS